MMLTVEEALRRVVALVEPRPAELVPLAEADGCVLVEDVMARRAQPPFPASAMDGYAVRAREAIEGATLQMAGESRAGAGFHQPLPAGAAVRIFTGAPVPQGADAILIQEDADREGEVVHVRAAPRPGEYVRPAGCDFGPGYTLSAPRRLTPRDVALLASMNRAEVAVAQRPVVALIPTGDELVMPGETPGADQIVTSNNFGLAAMLRRAGAAPRLCPIARDSREGLVAALEAARDADFIVTLGGASVGEHDLVRSVFGEEGLSLEFYKIAMRPGNPLMAGRLGNAVMVGLPGNPVSAMVCGEIFLRPAIDRALGLSGEPRGREAARIAHSLERNGPREHYMRARLAVSGEDGTPTCSLAESQDSSLLATLAGSDCLLIRAPRAEPLPAGAMVEIIRLD